MDKDVTDHLLGRLSAAYPDIDPTIYQVTARLSRLGEHLARRQEEVFGRVGLNRGEVGVLSALRLAGPPFQLTPTRLGRGLMLSSAGITSRLDRLESRGFVKRLADPDDRRGVLIELTPEGSDMVDAAIRANTESERELLAGFENGDVETLAALLRRLAGPFERSLGG